ncbi:uncharacterized protein METZ01_LOCUS497768, partial [marine metagenome]
RGSGRSLSCVLWAVRLCRLPARPSGMGGTVRSGGTVARRSSRLPARAQRVAACVGMRSGPADGIAGVGSLVANRRAKRLEWWSGLSRCMDRMSGGGWMVAGWLATANHGERFTGYGILDRSLLWSLARGRMDRSWRPIHSAGDNGRIDTDVGLWPGFPLWVNRSLVVTGLSSDVAYTHARFGAGNGFIRQSCQRWWGDFVWRRCSGARSCGACADYDGCVSTCFVVAGKFIVAAT